MKSLCVHMGSRLVTPSDPIRDYYCRVYAKTPGYLYPSPDFFEIPTWIPTLMGFMPDREAGETGFQCMSRPDLELAWHGPNVVVYGSVMDTTLGTWKTVAATYYKQSFVLGGYVDPHAFDYYLNVKYLPKINIVARGVNRGPDYRLFNGVGCIPRLALSSGCTHKCSFCTVPRVITDRQPNDIVTDADSFKPLKFELVYIDDKTFGQSKNWRMLAELGLRIKLYNPAFRGFIVQSTATEVLRHAEEWVRDYWVRVVETGVETLDDTTLRLWWKPHTADQCREAGRLMARLHARYGTLWVPNLIFGISGDLRGSHNYGPTLDTVYKWRTQGFVPFVNPYVLTQYADARGKVSVRVPGDKPTDASENTLDKSWLDYRDREAASEALETVLAMF